MRVLLVSEFYPPRISGIAQHVRRLAVNLAKRGHEVQVLISDPSNIETEDEENVRVVRTEHFLSGFDWIFTNKEMHYVPPVPDYLLKRVVSKVVKSFNPDIVHVHGWPMFTVALLKNRFPHLPMISTLHDYGFFCSSQTGYNMNEKSICAHRRPIILKCTSCARFTHGLIKGFAVAMALSVFRKLLNRMDYMITVSNYLGTIAAEAGIRNISVIPNFIDVSEMEEIEKSCFDNKEEYSTDILYVGVLAPYKGTHILLRASRTLANDFGIPVDLTLVGRLDSRWSFNTKCSRIKIVSCAPSHIVFSYMRHTKVVVIPPIWPETSSFATLEAMFFKKPVIASAIGGLKEIVIDRETGLLTTPNDHLGLAKAIKYLFERRGRIEDMGMKGYERIVNHFSAEKIMPKVENIYRRAAGLD